MTFGYAGALLAVARNILLVPLYLHFIPIAEYGAWLATGASLVQLLISDFGLAGVLMQRSSALHGAGEYSKLGNLIGSGIGAATGLAVVLALLSFCMLPFLPSFSGLSAMEWGRVFRCLELAVLAAAMSILASTAQGLIRSFQRTIVAGSVMLAADISNLLITIVLLYFGAGLYALALGVLARSCLALAILPAYLILLCRRELAISLRISWTTIQALFKDAVISFVSSVAMKLQTQANAFLVGVSLGPTSAAVYGLTVRAHETVLMFIGQMTGSFAPSMAHLLGSGNIARFREMILRIAVILALLAGIGMTVIAGINREFIALWLGDKVQAMDSVSILMSVAIWLATIGYIAYDALYAMGKFQTIAAVYVVVAIAHVAALSLLLKYGLWIAPLVTLLSSLSWGILFWRHVAVKLPLLAGEIRALLLDLVQIALFGAGWALVFIFFAPQAHGWAGLTASALGCGTAMLASLILVNTGIRSMIKNEISMTLRSMAAR